ncbi:heterokaryon incompatibility protein-domain-containing protein, partial [Rhypophila decipiens]
EVAEANEPYAILSHRWETDEVSFRGFQNTEKREKQAGFRKIELACQEALQDGIGFVWVDTCCIDKASSAELSEAINSMFNWYHKATVCYAYLSDAEDLDSTFFESKCLILRGETPIQQISIAKRMSWAARRETTRPEDTAYCLMGIFDVNMPMLYGEGPKAFIRLQEEILRDSEDQSLFAWTASEESAKQAPYRGLFALSPA